MEQEHKNKIEALLFTTGRFMDIGEISKLAGIGSIGLVKEAIQELKKEYEQKDSALEILEENSKWKLNIKKGYSHLTHQLLTDTELDKPTQETLAIIAFKQPALQSEVVKIRGNKAYDHVRNLKETQFITSEKFGRTRLLKLTPKFFDYFDIGKKEIKEKMEEAGRKMLTQPTQEKPEEKEEVEKIKEQAEGLRKEQDDEEPEPEEPPEKPPGPYPHPDPDIHPDPEPTPEPSPEPGIGPGSSDESQAGEILEENKKGSN